MGPIFPKLKKANEGKSIRFYYLDFTDEKTTIGAKKKGMDAGIEDLTLFSGKTGVIVLVNRDDYSMIEKLTVDYTLEEMQESIDDALAE